MSQKTTTPVAARPAHAMPQRGDRLTLALLDQPRAVGHASTGHCMAKAAFMLLLAITAWR